MKKMAPKKKKGSGPRTQAFGNFRDQLSNAGFSDAMKNVGELKDQYEASSDPNATLSSSNPYTAHPVLPKPPIKSPDLPSMKDLNLGGLSSCDHYPLNNVQNFVALLKGSDVYNLNFTGVEMLTDITFAVCILNHPVSTFSVVESINLTGCRHITDVSLSWMSILFPKLKKLILAGCNKITETGIKSLVIACKSLQEVDLTGTSVAIVPMELADLNVKLDGCPLVSPDFKSYSQHGVQVLKASNYKKPADKELIKICIVRSNGLDQSLAKYLTGDKDLSVTSAIVKELKLKSKTTEFSSHIIESDKLTMNYFVTKRALFILPYEANTSRSAEEVANEISAVLLQIMAKIAGAVFIVAGISKGKLTLSDNAVKSALENILKSTKTKLQTFVNSNLKDQKKLSDITFEQQQEFAKVYTLLYRIEYAKISSFSVDLNKSMKEQSTIETSLIQGLEVVVELNPEYGDLIHTVFKMATDNHKIPDMLKDGVLSMQGKKSNIQYTMKIFEELGRAVCLEILGESRLVLYPKWFADVLSVALSPPTEGFKNDGTVYCVNEGQIMWKMDVLEKALTAKCSKDQAMQAMGLLMKLGLGFTSSEFFIPFNLLGDEPPVAWDNLMKSKTKSDIHASYNYEFSHVVPESVIHQIQGHALEMRRPMMLWKYGIIEQEGLVDVIICLKNYKDTSCIEMKAQTPYQGTPQSENSEMLWQALEQYKLIVDYVIKQQNLWAHVTSQSDVPKPDFIFGFITNHKMEVPVIEDVSKPEMCMRCGLPASNCRKYLLMFEYLYPSQVVEELVIDKEVIFTRSGNILSPSKDKGIITFKTKMSPFESSNFKFTALNAASEKGKISLGVKRPDESINIGISLKDKKVYSDIGGQKGKDIPLPEDSSVVGDSFEFHFSPSATSNKMDGKNMWEIEVFKGLEILGKFTIPQGIMYPFLSTEEGTSKSDQKPSIMIHGSFIQMSKITDVMAGMRCEALDRLNPSLICAATIQDIDENGRFLIHFDGWTSRYDYWTEPETADIHPIGFMKTVGHSLQSVNPELQAPKGYRKAFEWGVYCEEMQCLPVPYEFFNEDQKQGAPPDAEYEVLEYLGEGIKKSTGVSKLTPCNRALNCSKAVEFEAMKECTVGLKKELVEFFTSHNKHFCLLPRSMTLTNLKYPLTNNIVGNPSQQIHFLCSGNKMELLHFVDDEGLDLKTYSNSVSSLAPFLQMCYVGLILQEAVMPLGAKKICSGVPDAGDENMEARVELWMKRICFQYLMAMIVHSRKILASQQKYTDAQMMLQKVSEDNGAIEKLKNIFHGITGSGAIKCQSHNIAMSSGKDMKEISEDTFQKSFHFLQKLDFQNNSLEKMPAGLLAKFTKLEELNLSHNLLTELPISLCNSKILTHLLIASNKITVIPDSLEHLKETLIVLDISGNPLGNLPACIFKLINLQEFRASNIGTVDMKGIGALTDLRILSLSHNVITSVPEELGGLPLEELDLAGVPWFPHLVTGNVKTQPTYPAFKNILSSYNVFGLMKEERLKELFQKVDKDSSGTLQISELIEFNNHIYDIYPRFGQKNLANKKYGGVPEPLFKLTKLTKLDLSFHGITQITDAAKVFESLRSLDVSHNPNLESLSAELGGLPLKEIHLKGCTSMKTPPKEVIGRGFSAVYGYLKRLQQGAVACRRTKLMMVGLGGAGKTSLVRALTSRNYTAYMDYGEQITDGIDITDWNVRAQSGDDVTYSVWDFAGQTVYYNTHQFFLSNRAVYLLLWNIRLGYEHAGLDFWLSSIACHAPKAPILVVGTHCDKVKQSKIPQSELKKRFPQIAAFHFVSSYSGEGIGGLKNSLLEETLKQKYMGERIPEAWLRLETEIFKFRDENLDLLPWKKVERSANDVGIFDEMELVQAVQFLHDLGSLQFFNTDFLKSYVVIYPQWIVDVMACIVTVHEGPIKEGKLIHDNMKEVWDKYDPSLHPWLLRLTEEFDLTFPLVDEPANLVPCLLPDVEPQYTWPTLEEDSMHRESKMIYKFVYLPAGLFNRAQVRLNQFSEGGLIWKKGSFLKKSGHIAIMIQSGPTEVTVKAQGFKPENLLFLVHEMFETLIAESYGGVQYEFLIPCFECQTMNVMDPSMFSSSKIHRATELHAPFLQCDKLFHTLSIPELKAVMPPEKTENLDDHLRRSVQELQDLGEDVNMNVFFCYTKKNVPDLANENKVIHPGRIMEDLRSSGFNVSFTDTPETADLEMLTLSFKTAKVIVIGLSDEFCQSETCRKLVLFTRDTLRKPILLLLLGETREWKKTSLGMNIGSEVYVKTKGIENYATTIKELKEAIYKKATKSVVEEYPRVFLSYCWANSIDAVSKGSGKNHNEKAIGWADPRKIKEFIQEQGVTCWLDVERVGELQGGLFEDINDGLKHAKVLVACVSDEYPFSKNCMMEFRFALSTLRIPVILAVVGTGYAWERSEIGMLAVGSSCPKVNFQHPNQEGFMELYKLISNSLPEDVTLKSDSEKVETQRKAAFQEAIEFSQRQFLRHVTTYAESMYSSHYPRLIVVDMEEKQKTAEELEMEEEDRYVEKLKLAAVAAAAEGVPAEKLLTAAKLATDRPTSEQGSTVESSRDGDEEEVKKGQKYCWRLLCEHEGGWHEVSPSIPFPDLESGEEENYLSQIALFAARIFALLKYTNIKLDSLNTPEGKRLQEKLQAYAAEANKSDFQEEYCSIRTAVMEADIYREMGGLKRCHMMSGKTLWLCEEHQHGSGSKTDERFKQQLLAASAQDGTDNTDQRPSTARLSKNRSEGAGKVSSKDSKTLHQSSLFKMRESGNKKQGKLKRQTSQACSVM